MCAAAFQSSVPKTQLLLKRLPHTAEPWITTGSRRLSCAWRWDGHRWYKTRHYSEENDLKNKTSANAVTPEIIGLIVINTAERAEARQSQAVITTITLCVYSQWHRYSASILRLCWVTVYALMIVSAWGQNTTVHQNTLTQLRRRCVFTQASGHPSRISRAPPIFYFFCPIL